MSKFPPVVILAGGLGTRMSDLYPDLPKALIPLHNDPFIAHQLRLLARQSVGEVIMCAGHLSKQLEDYVGSGDKFGLKVSYSYDGDKLLGTGGAVLKAIQNLSEPFAVLYGDSYLDTAFLPIKQAFYEAKKFGLMTVYKNNNLWDKSNILADNGIIIEYNKINPKANMQFIDYGLSIFDPLAFKDFPQDQAFDLSEVIHRLIELKQLSAYSVPDRFYEIGSSFGLKELETYLSGKK